ncbi:MAG: hypothetical protein ACK5ZS_01230 [bacterium]|jgi:hypothetical protein
MMDNATPPPVPKPANPLDTTNYRLHVIEQTLGAIRDNLVRLSTLEERHLHTREALNRAFSALEKHDARLAVIEQEMPTLRLVRGWVIGGVVGTLAMLGAIVAKLFTLTVG